MHILHITEYDLPLTLGKEQKTKALEFYNVLISHIQINSTIIKLSLHDRKGYKLIKEYITEYKRACKFHPRCWM